MRPCCVPNCDNKTAPRHAFPRNHRVRSIWLERINNAKLRNDISFLKSYIVCENHFHNISIERVGKLKAYAVPVLHLPDYQEESLEENCFSYSPTFKRKRSPDNIRVAVILNGSTSSLDDIQELKVKTPDKTYGRPIKRHLEFNIKCEDIEIYDPVLSTTEFCIDDVIIPKSESEADPNMLS